ncbi:putative ribosomal protein s17 [Golovinomyces cichoracearum]|uniref:Putative ribosomal protein s17 n=1 Tax=Golovinomyces cichoracearum TaxID=62708 RepID=A0A420HN01_9PEZI|nr:putative ribosomal protein s17 [Golovinomyces cichoracearum]
MAVRKAVEKAARSIPAVVISAGLMQKTVKVRIGVQQWDSLIKKNFNRSRNVLVHDPNDSLRTGDIISISPGWRISKSVRHIVDKLVAPFGTPAEERPPILTFRERMNQREEKRLWKLENKKTKRKGLFTPKAPENTDTIDGEGDQENKTGNKTV